MNGRVYDYNLGRFMSVDPFVQSSTGSQSLNPYSYLLNNPLSGVDPTGYCGTNIKDKSANFCQVYGAVESDEDDEVNKIQINHQTNQVTISAQNGKGQEYTVNYTAENSQMDFGSQENVANQNFLVSRPLDDDVLKYSFAHMFVASGARYIGDEDAKIHSFGKLADGKTGNVGEGSVPDEISEGAHGTDFDFWVGLKNNLSSQKIHTIRIPASTETVNDFSDSLIADTNYFIFFIPESEFTNSNSAALAIAIRAAWHDNREKVIIPLPDPFRAEPNATGWHNINFQGKRDSKKLLRESYYKMKYNAEVNNE